MDSNKNKNAKYTADKGELMLKWLEVVTQACSMTENGFKKSVYAKITEAPENLTAQKTLIYGNNTGSN